MAQITYDEVNLMLRLYELRREPRLREARAWFVEHFHAGTPEEVMQKYPQGSQENTYIRMVISYWDMVASIVNRGMINDELFFESNGLRKPASVWKPGAKSALRVRVRPCVR